MNNECFGMQLANMLEEIFKVVTGAPNNPSDAFDAIALAADIPEDKIAVATHLTFNGENRVEKRMIIRYCQLAIEVSLIWENGAQKLYCGPSIDCYDEENNFVGTVPMERFDILNSCK